MKGRRLFQPMNDALSTLALPQSRRRNLEYPRTRTPVRVRVWPWHELFFEVAISKNHPELSPNAPRSGRAGATAWRPALVAVHAEMSAADLVIDEHVNP